MRRTGLHAGYEEAQQEGTTESRAYGTYARKDIDCTHVQATQAKVTCRGEISRRRERTGVSNDNSVSSRDDV